MNAAPPHTSILARVLGLAGVVALLLVMPVSALGQDTPQRARIVAPTSSSLCDVSPASRLVEDVRTKVRGMDLNDGATMISRTRSGLQLVALVDDGAVLDYAVIDGQVVRSRPYRHRPPAMTVTPAAGSAAKTRLGRSIAGRSTAL